MKQTGWYSARPDPAQAKDKPKPILKSRWELDTLKNYPDVSENWKKYVDLLFEIGPTTVIPMTGEDVLSHQEIYYYQRNMKINLEPFEVDFIRSLSREYLEGKHEGEKLQTIKPYLDGTFEGEQAKQEAITKSLKDIFGAKVTNN